MLTSPVTIIALDFFMSRARRLLDLVQELRSHRNPVTGAKLAEATGVSLRTLYRDIDALKAQGAPIEGEPGLGYVLMPGFMLPPLMFTEDEIEFFDLHITSDVVHGERGYQIVLDCADTPALQQRCLKLVQWGAEMRFSYTKGLYDTYVADDLELAAV